MADKFITYKNNIYNLKYDIHLCLQGAYNDDSHVHLYKIYGFGFLKFFSWDFRF